MSHKTRTVARPVGRTRRLAFLGAGAALCAVVLGLAACSSPETPAAAPVEESAGMETPQPAAGYPAPSAPATSSPVAETGYPAPIAAGGTSVVTTTETAFSAVDDWARLTTGSNAVLAVDDWLSDNEAGNPESAVSINLGAGGNAMRILPSTVESARRPWSIDISYGITRSEPDDFVGFDRDLDPSQDWSGASQVVVDADARSAPDVQLVFQFREGSGEVWRFAVPTAALTPGMPIRIPLDTEHFKRTDWSTQANQAIDLDTINQYGFYVGHTGPGRSGTVTLGAIVVCPVKAPSAPQ